MASIFKMCGKYLIKNKYSVICYGVLCLTSSMFSMISPYISGNFIDYLIVADNISKIYRYYVIDKYEILIQRRIHYGEKIIYLGIGNRRASRQNV